MKAFILILLVAGPAYGCVWDVDCQVGSTCLKEQGSLYGVCAGGMRPGNSNDRVPVRDPLDLTGKVGNTCTSNFDCGIGGRCQMSGLQGVCL